MLIPKSESDITTAVAVLRGVDTSSRFHVASLMEYYYGGKRVVVLSINAKEQTQ